MVDDKENIEESQEKPAVVFDSWEDYAVAQLDTIFEALLPVSSGGGITIEYKKHIIGTQEDGTKLYDKTKAVGVKVIVDLDFDQPTPIE